MMMQYSDAAKKYANGHLQRCKHQLLSIIDIVWINSVHRHFVRFCTLKQGRF